MTNTFYESPSLLLTSESVTEGHPDKLCDQVSDAVLDAMLEQDPNSRVACETAVTTGLVLILGEITTEAYVDLEHVVRNTVKDAASSPRSRSRPPTSRRAWTARTRYAPGAPRTATTSSAPATRA